jgi:hypothetical protein
MNSTLWPVTSVIAISKSRNFGQHLIPNATQIIINFNVYKYIKGSTYPLLKLFHILLTLLLSMYI